MEQRAVASDGLLNAGLARHLQDGLPIACVYETGSIRRRCKDVLHIGITKETLFERLHDKFGVPSGTVLMCSYKDPADGEEYHLCHDDDIQQLILDCLELPVDSRPSSKKRLVLTVTASKDLYAPESACQSHIEPPSDENKHGKVVAIDKVRPLRSLVQPVDFTQVRTSSLQLRCLFRRAIGMSLMSTTAFVIDINSAQVPFA